MSLLFLRFSTFFSKVVSDSTVVILLSFCGTCLAMVVGQTLSTVCAVASVWTISGNSWVASEIRSLLLVVCGAIRTLEVIDYVH